MPTEVHSIVPVIVVLFHCFIVPLPYDSIRDPNSTPQLISAELEGRFSLLIDNAGFTLKIHDVELTDGAMYTCVAKVTEDSPASSCVCQLTVRGLSDGKICRFVPLTNETRIDDYIYIYITDGKSRSANKYILLIQL